jgi:hypothetical protein
LKKKFFSIVPKRYSSVLEAIKTIFGHRYSLPNFTFLFLVESFVQNLTPTRRGEHWEKNNFPQGGMLKFIQRLFFDNKNSIWKVLGLKIQTVETWSSASSTCRNIYFWKTLKSQLLVVFQIFIFGQIWADFPAFTVAESMPKLGLKSSKPHNFLTVSPNVTCNGSLESYHPYL